MNPSLTSRQLARLFLLGCLFTAGPAPAQSTAAAGSSAPAAAASSADALGPGDSVRVTVFRHPDLSTEVRVSDRGTVSLPLVGEVNLKGLSSDAAALRIASKLKDGKFLVAPQVSVSLLQLRSRQVSVLGDVQHPGRYALEDPSAKLTDILAMAGGTGPLAADTVTVMSNRGGKPFKTEVDLRDYLSGTPKQQNLDIRSGDTVFVPRAPVFYIYGEVQRGGAYKLEQGMTVMQAISLGGGITLRGSDRRIEIRRKNAQGQLQESSARLADVVRPDDVIYVKESFF